MKRIATYAVLLAALLLSLYAAIAFAANDNFNFTAHLDWKNKNDFPGKYVDAGLYRGEDNFPYYDGKNVVALYDPVDMSGYGPGLYWQGYWNAEESRNMETSEMDNPVFLVAEYEEGQLIRLKEISEEEMDRFMVSQQTPANPERDALRSKIEKAYEAYIGTHSTRVLGIADRYYGELCRTSYPPQEEIEEVYLLTYYEGSDIVGFTEVTEEEYLLVAEPPA